MLSRAVLRRQAGDAPDPALDNLNAQLSYASLAPLVTTEGGLESLSEQVSQGSQAGRTYEGTQQQEG